MDTLSSKEAARLLGIKEATLYAYVSRGMIRSVESEGGDPRARRYLRDDVEALAARKAHRRDPAKAASAALDWGAPVMESALTRIEAGKLYYRGEDAAALASTSTFEEVAALLWGVETPRSASQPGIHPLTPSPTSGEGEQRNIPDLAELQAKVALAGMSDLRAYDVSAEGAAATGARILRLLVEAISGRSGDERAADALAAVFGAPARLFDAALILLADHELNASSFAARVVASTGAHPYAAVSAAMAALSGPKHGGAVLGVHALITEAEADGQPERVLAARVRRGEPVPGFGHKLYPDGDPRYQALMAACEAQIGSGPRYGLCRALADAGAVTTGQKPNIDFALATLVYTIGLPSSAGPALFALGRSAGWVAHAIEQYADGRLIRPRAKYVGQRP
jgi:citrate synthase